MGLFDWLRDIFGGSAATLEEREEEERATAAIRTIDASNAEVGGLNFQSALEAHMKWRMRLQDVVNGVSKEKLDPEVVEKDDHCVLGKWLYGEGERYKDLEGFSKVKLAHAEFHGLAAGILRKALTGNKAEAQALLTGEYRRCSVRIGGLLAGLHAQGSKMKMSA